MKKIVIDPLTRVHSTISVEATIDNRKVVDARCSVLVFRGFELILKGRDPRDASYLTERICGICPSAHGTAASFALEDAAGVRPPRNGNILRNLILGADLLQNHIRHFYLYALPDYVRGPQVGTLTPCYTRGYRLPDKINGAMMDHYWQSVETSRLAHEMVTLLGGKAPFTHGLLAGGSTVPPAADILMDFRSKLRRIYKFVKNTMLPDTQTIAEAYPDYYQIGVRQPNLLEFGLFPQSNDNGTRHFPPGVVIDGRRQDLDSSVIREDLASAWYTGDSDSSHPFQGRSHPDPDKEGAYSWVKAPRYGGRALEGGPLARLWIRGDYRRGVSTMDRVMARAQEAEMVGKLMDDWVDELEPGQPVYHDFAIPEEAEGVGLTGAMRGPLGHWLKIRRGRINHYQVITPTAWNLSTRDSQGRMGPVEEALIGTPVADYEEPIEIGRVIRAFDICSSCSTHVIIPGFPAREMVVTI